MSSLGTLVSKALGFNSDRRRVENQLNEILYGNLINFKDVVFYNYCKEDFITKGYMANAEVYSIVRKIVDKCSFAPMYVYIDKEDKKAMRYKSCKRSIDRVEHAKYNIYRTKSLDFAPENNDLSRLIDRPNEQQTWAELVELLRIFYFVQGEAFLYRETAEGSDIAQSVHVCPANLMEPVFGGTIDGPITGWKLNMLNGSIRKLDAKDVFQLKMANPKFDSMGSQLRGMSPLEAGQRYLQLDDSAVKAWLNGVVNEGAKGLISPNHADPKLWLSPTQVDALQDSIEKKIHGTENKNKVIASAMPLQYTAIGLSPQALAVIDGLKYSNIKLCDLWGVPPVLFDPNPTYQNMKEARERFVNEVILPYLSKEEDALNRWLVEPFRRQDKRNYVLDYDTSVYDELKLDLEERKALAEILSINEMRVLEGWEELPEEVANQVFISQGKVPLSEYEMGITLNDDLNK
ncbi:phage portal protein BeeE [Sphingobacterium allocomposti]|uniref:Phage portal protein BeeE n=1 Tax=Sphingobacterium allocomposti TaxID=415956 RepID=A0A5S5D1Y4_9SPHI|nr:phage portal protein [Sphingobacterium composti Yoo et al. 2007 non Ten et al. 2007]TYP89414.1 phage portal protein BeeE [Sphingobacterium composti Yoo et al. 2007 non Ten et al. 2007]